MSKLVHAWDLAPQEALALQKKLARQVIRENRLGPVATVAGIDVGQNDDLDSGNCSYRNRCGSE